MIRVDGCERESEAALEQTDASCYSQSWAQTSLSPRAGCAKKLLWVLAPDLDQVPQSPRHCSTLLRPSVAEMPRSSSPSAPSDISAHLDALFNTLPPVGGSVSQAKGADDDAQTQSLAWEQLIDRWEDELARSAQNEVLDRAQNDVDVELDIEEDPPQPSLLDYYAQSSADRTAAAPSGQSSSATTGRDTQHAINRRSGAFVNERPPIGASPAQAPPSGPHAVDPAIAGLVDRIRT